jgi:cytochrome c-type biogenesis protein CcmE
MSKGFQIAGGATLIALLLGWYAASNLQEGASFTYYKTLGEFAASPEAQSGIPARVHGYVVPESIQRDVEGQRVTFAVQATPPHAGGPSDVKMPVVFASLETPDMFKGGAEVVLEGRLARDGATSHFAADKLLAKCPSKFEGVEGATAAGGTARPPSTKG